MRNLWRQISGVDTEPPGQRPPMSMQRCIPRASADLHCVLLQRNDGEGDGDSDGIGDVDGVGDDDGATRQAQNSGAAER